jgi:hypothetical protein
MSQLYSVDEILASGGNFLGGNFLLVFVLEPFKIEDENEDDDEDDWKTLDFGLRTLDFNLRACQKC